MSIKIPYERIVQWLSGPISIAAGAGATYVVNHFNFIGTLGFSKASIVHGIVSISTFAVGAGVTALGHWKWLDNLSKYWTTPLAQTTTTAAADPASQVTDPEEDLNQGPGDPDSPNSAIWQQNRQKPNATETAFTATAGDAS